jgi:hypothetical protein
MTANTKNEGRSLANEWISLPISLLGLRIFFLLPPFDAWIRLRSQPRDKYLNHVPQQVDVQESENNIRNSLQKHRSGFVTEMIEERERLRDAPVAEVERDKATCPKSCVSDLDQERDRRLCSVLRHLSSFVVETL